MARAASQYGGRLSQIARCCRSKKRFVPMRIRGCPVAATSPTGGAITAAHRGVRPRDRAGAQHDRSGFRAAETALSRAKPWKVKDYSDGARKPESRGTAWWAWQDSNPHSDDYDAKDQRRLTSLSLVMRATSTE
jgi:hypothetical protein